jgi:hypothetical protein
MEYSPLMTSTRLFKLFNAFLMLDIVPKSWPPSTSEWKLMRGLSQQKMYSIWLDFSSSSEMKLISSLMSFFGRF